MLEFLRDAYISRHGQFEVRSDLERYSSSDDDSLPDNSMEDDDKLDMCKEILYNEIGNANQKRRAMVRLGRQSHPDCRQGTKQKTFTQSALEPERKPITTYTVCTVHLWPNWSMTGQSKTSIYKELKRKSN